VEARLGHYRRFLLYHLAPFLLRASTRHRRILQVLQEPGPVRALIVHREFTRFMMASKDQPPSAKCESANAPLERSSQPALPGQTDEVLPRRDELLAPKRQLPRAQPHEPLVRHHRYAEVDSGAQLQIVVCVMGVEPGIIPQNSGGEQCQESVMNGAGSIPLRR
jgi:hypothetical protein